MSVPSLPAATPIAPSELATCAFNDESEDGGFIFENALLALSEALFSFVQSAGSAGFPLSELSAPSSGLSAFTPWRSYWLVESVPEPPQPAIASAVAIAMISGSARRRGNSASSKRRDARHPT